MRYLEDSYWWFVGRKYALQSLIDTEYGDNPDCDILDIGCGTGSMLTMLKKYGKVVGSDISELALSFCRKRGCTNLIKTSADNLALPNESFDLITAFDIIEHLDDDKKALQEFYRVCRKGGNVIVTVPAYNFLWSEHDRALQHKRRYVRKELSEKLISAGFKIKKISYFVTFLLPIIAVFRIYQNLFNRSKTPDTDYIMPPAFLNRIFIWLLMIEGIIIKYFSFPAGVSLVCIAEKPGKE